MVAVARLIIELTLTDVTGSTYAGESDKRKAVVRPKHTSQYIFRCCPHEHEMNSLQHDKSIRDLSSKLYKILCCSSRAYRVL